MVQVIRVERWKGKAGSVTLNTSNVDITFAMGNDQKLVELSRVRHAHIYRPGCTYIPREDYRQATRVAYGVLLQRRPNRTSNLQLELGLR